MTSFYKLFLVISLYFLTSCSGMERNKIDTIVYGVYAGECYGHCATMYKLEKNKLFMDTTDSFFKNNSKSVTFNDSTLNTTDFLKARIIREQLPDFLLESNGKTFGSPDTHDQGGIFVQIKSGLTTKSFYIDTDLEQIPDELRSYAKLIMKVTGFDPL